LGDSGATLMRAELFHDRRNGVLLAVVKQEGGGGEKTECEVGHQRGSQLERRKFVCQLRGCFGI
jgi:hypothetical protein